MPEPIPLSVLIIEDDRDARLNLCDILELDGYAVESVESIAEALRVKDWSDLFAVILDRKLPDGNAEDFLPRLAQLAPSAAVIIVTGYADLDGAVAALRQGAADYILKPINPGSLRNRLANLAEHRRVKNALAESQLELRQERDFAESLVETAQAVVLVLDSAGRIVRFNPYLQELTGYTLDELRGQDWLTTLLPESDRERMDKVFQETLDKGTSVSVSPIQTRNARCRHVRWSNKVLQDATQCRIGVLAIAQDITELREAQERALQTERLAAIGQMVAGLAHESRNALQRSQACLEMLALEIQDRPGALDLVGRIQQAQDHLHHLYEEVRGYAAPMQFRSQPVDLREILLQTWEHLLLQRQGRMARLTLEEFDGDLKYHADRRAIEQVFRNILENSLAACADPVEIFVGWSVSQLRGRPAIQISLRDNGPGLTAEQRERIFEPFFTTKTHGTGLGMAIVKRIVEAHGGEIAVAPNRESGAEILILLPRPTSTKGNA